jgi:predicted ATPase/DNA-binding CsgD family transcriptional regulator/transcriptional regulator with XRE-family HTH domain
MAEQATLGFSGLLRQLRAEAGLTQGELAKAAGLSPRSVSDLERGINRTARKDTAVRLAGALGLADPVRSLFVAAALGRMGAVQVLAAGRGQAPRESLAPARGLHGFVPALTSFVGRAGPVSQVAALLERSRLVTVTGPGGAGKSRLAVEVARQVAGRFDDGVWLAELAPVRDPALVPAVVAAALGVREQPGLPAAVMLARVLARRQLLLVLDNCEHVIGAAAGLCAGLLVACDEVRVLATSREPLRVAGEARLRLAPLTLPGPGDQAGAASECEAVALFVDRARQADMNFLLDEQTGPEVARLVTRLDGMPLAIELAAARVEALGVRQLLDRIDDRFTLLTAGDRLAAGRQQSLAAAVDWSYQLLDEHERRVFRLMSVFPGPFTIEAAEAVAGSDAGPRVLHLVDCSLLSPPRAGADGRSRYQMLETLRAYGAALLARAGEQARADAALARHALQVAEQASAGLQTTTEEAPAAAWLDAEDATLGQALAWALDHDADAAARLAAALAPWWLLRGRLAGQSLLLRQAASRAEPGSQAWCTALFWLGSAAGRAGDLPGALGHATAVYHAIADRGPSRDLADCLARRAQALADMGRIAEAAEEGHRALAMARQLGYPAGEALALEYLTITAYLADDLDGARRFARQAGQITADIPGWLARVRSFVRTAILGDAGDLAGAEQSCAAGLAWSRHAGDLWAQAGLLTFAAGLDLRQGRISDAAAHLHDALQTAARIGDLADVLNAMVGCGNLCAATGRHAEALIIWAAASGTTNAAGYALAPAYQRRRRQAESQAREALGDARTRTAQQRGAAMSLATATEYALMLTSPGPQPIHAPPAASKLTAREKELVTLVAQGLTNAQIAAELYISARTVSSHLDRIRDKTGCRRRADLTRLALTTGLV